MTTARLQAIESWLARAFIFCVCFVIGVVIWTVIDSFVRG